MRRGANIGRTCMVVHENVWNAMPFRPDLNAPFCDAVVSTSNLCSHIFNFLAWLHSGDFAGVALHLHNLPQARKSSKIST